jgi:hypothetical protein
MKEYKILISISAENESDMEEIIGCYEIEHTLEREWWCEVIK